jgi:methyl-accepting chemotaxis protein
VGVLAVVLLALAANRFLDMLQGTESVTDRIKVLHEVEAQIQDYRQRETRLLFINSSKEAEQQEEAMKRAFGKSEQAFAELLLLTPADRQSAMHALQSAMASYKKSGLEFLKLSQDDARRADAEAHLNDQTQKAFDVVGARLAEVSKLQFELTAQQQAATRAEAKRMLWTGLTVLGAVSLLVGLLAYLLIRQITASIQRAVHIAQAVAGGNLSLSVEVQGKDETAQLLRALSDMSSSLVNIVSEVRQGTELIAAASGQIASGNADLSQRTEVQASALQQTAATMNDLAGRLSQTSDHARQASTQAQAASAVAQRGGAVVGEVVDTMQSINESSRRIVDIIAVIDGIAFQTNILALNAAVEAARAGEQGRGFAVVAAEVRSLAHRSAEAAKEIKVLIGTSVGKVEAGTRLVSQAGNTMGDIVSSVNLVNQLIGDMSAANNEQTNGIRQVNEAISHMDRRTPPWSSRPLRLRLRCGVKRPACPRWSAASNSHTERSRRGCHRRSCQLHRSIPVPKHRSPPARRHGVHLPRGCPIRLKTLNSGPPPLTKTRSREAGLHRWSCCWTAKRSRWPDRLRPFEPGVGTTRCAARRQQRKHLTKRQVFLGEHTGANVSRPGSGAGGLPLQTRRAPRQLLETPP